MHKKLERDLVSLAHSILQMKNREDVFLLKKTAKEVYEKLSVLAFVEEYVNTTPKLEITKEELVEKVSKAFENKENKEKNVQISEDLFTESTPDLPPIKNVDEPVKEQLKLETTSNNLTEITEQPFDELQAIMFPENDTATNFKNDKKDVGDKKTPTLEEELQDTISVDVMADLFENVHPKSLNDKFAKNIQIDLNDRIAFVKNLFHNEHENYNRVISQLNTFKTEKEAKKFINKMVKPDYNWEKHELLEARFMEIIERKFA